VLLLDQLADGNLGLVEVNAGQGGVPGRCEAKFRPDEDPLRIGTWVNDADHVWLNDENEVTSAQETHPMGPGNATCDACREDGAGRKRICEERKSEVRSQIRS